MSLSPSRCGPGQRLDEASAWREPSSHGDVLHVDGIIVALRTDEHVERLADDDSGMLARHTTLPGSHTLVALLASADEPLILPTLKTIDQRIDRTDKAWREWSGNLIVDGPYASHVRRRRLSAEASSFFAERRDRRGRDDLAAGAHRRRQELRLPIRLDPRRRHYTIKAFLRVGRGRGSQGGLLLATDHDPPPTRGARA